MADILTGKIPPSGKLPVTFYCDASELPDFEDYSMKGRTYRYFNGQVLYPFGYGLTYGSAELTGVKINGQTVVKGGEVRLSENDRLQVDAMVSNTGDTELREVVQVYIKALDSADAVPNGRLCGFAGVNVRAGESRTTAVPLDADAMMVINEEGEKVSGGRRFEVSVGFGQPDARTGELTGKEPLTFTAVCNFRS